MAIPRSTLITGAIALVSSSAVVYLLLRPPAPTEEEPAYTPAQPGALNPIAAKVLSEGGPRTPTATSAGGLKRATGHLEVHFDSPDTVGPCLTTLFDGTERQLGEAATDLPACPGNGAHQVEGTLTLATAPVGTFGAPNQSPTQATCTATFRGTRTDNGAANPINLKLVATGDLQNPCTSLRQSFPEALLTALR